MNIFYKISILTIVLFSSLAMYAQDNNTSLQDVTGGGPYSVKSLNWRVWGGPEASFMLSGDKSVMKGMRIGFSGGLEINKSLSSSNASYFITGLSFNTGGFERWDNDVKTAGLYTVEKMTAVEIPLGVGFNFGKNKPKGFFTNVMLIPSYSISTETNYFVNEFKQDLQNNKKFENDRINLGGKVELGIKTFVDKNNYTSFSLSFKPMLINPFSSNANKYTTMNIAALAGFYF